MSKIKEFIDDSFQRIAECEENGEHLDPIYFEQVISSANLFPHSAKGMCKHCDAYITRSLTQKNLEEAAQYRKLLTTGKYTQVAL
jgi:hypothetical protein